MTQSGVREDGARQGVREPGAEKTVPDEDPADDGTTSRHGASAGGQTASADEDTPAATPKAPRPRAASARRRT
ncbi:hypothetical protein ACFU0V_31180, partial [Streptomyces sp. NPDC057398]